MKLTKEVANPRCLSYNICNPVVFSLGTRTRQCVLTFEGPRLEVVTKKNTVSRSRSAHSQTTCLVSIKVKEKQEKDKIRTKPDKNGKRGKARQSTMADNRTMAEMLRAPTEGCAEAIVVPPILAEQFELKHSLINMMTSEQLFGLEKDNPHDHIRAARRWLEKEPPHQDFLNAAAGVNQQTSAVTTAMTAMLKQLQTTPPPASVKAIEETYVTCGGAHPYYQCLAVGGNTFLEFRDNIQGYVLAAAGNYNQGNLGYRPQGVANQMRPPSFAQPNVQNIQNRFGPPQGFNHGNNFNQEQSYQATAHPNQNFHLNELEKIKRMNDVTIKAMQNQIDMNISASLLQMNTPSTSGSGYPPSNTVANPKGELKAITILSGLVTNGPTVPTPPKSVTPKVGERVEDTYTDPDLAEYTIKVPPTPESVATDGKTLVIWMSTSAGNISFLNSFNRSWRWGCLELFEHSRHCGSHSTRLLIDCISLAISELELTSQAFTWEAIGLLRELRT
nr:hypothetical protein [Tanacetum cinerariifolium]